MKCPHCGRWVKFGGLSGEVRRLYQSGLTPPEIFRLLRSKGYFANYLNENSARASIGIILRREAAK